jgi:hypothetical protein
VVDSLKKMAELLLIPSALRGFSMTGNNIKMGVVYA